jgi:hypothetical protein
VQAKHVVLEIALSDELCNFRYDDWISRQDERTRLFQEAPRTLVPITTSGFDVDYFALRRQLDSNRSRDVSLLLFIWRSDHGPV